jgi:hypothetical protein
MADLVRRSIARRALLAGGAALVALPRPAAGVTTITKQIGTNGVSDYSSLNAWTADTTNFPTDLVAANVAVVGLVTTSLFSTGTILTLSGHNTDSTHTITLMAAPGKGFRDNPARFRTALNYNEANGVGIHSTVAGFAIVLTDSNVTFSGLQLLNSNGNSALECGPSPIPTNFSLTNCIIRANSTIHSCSLMGVTAANCLFILASGGGQETVLINGGGGNFYNCTTVCLGGGNSNHWGADNQSISMNNCAMFGAPNLTAGSTPGTWTWANCMSDTVTKADPATYVGAPVLVTYANQFVDNTLATGDLRTKAGANLIGAGTVDLTHAAADILGTTRVPTPDIGAYQTALTIPSGLGGNWLHYRQ